MRNVRMILTDAAIRVCSCAPMSVGCYYQPRQTFPCALASASDAFSSGCDLSLSLDHETSVQAHMRLPKSSLSGTASRGRGGGSSRLALATTPRVRPNSARV